MVVQWRGGRWWCGGGAAVEWGEAGEVVVVAMAGEAGEVGRSAADVTQGVGEDRRHHTGRLMGGLEIEADSGLTKRDPCLRGTPVTSNTSREGAPHDKRQPWALPPSASLTSALPIYVGAPRLPDAIPLGRE